jgi:hypothetical protein
VRGYILIRKGEDIGGCAGLTSIKVSCAKKMSENRGAKNLLGRRKMRPHKNPLFILTHELLEKWVAVCWLRCRLYSAMLPHHHYLPYPLHQDPPQNKGWGSLLKGRRG